jgi:hypothetical protein
LVGQVALLLHLFLTTLSTVLMKMTDPIHNLLIRRLQLHPSLYCLMATDEQAALMINVIADAIEYEGLSGTTVDWLRTQARETK